MTRSDFNEEMRDDAVSWFVRLQDCDDEAVWLAHRDWLEADAAHAAAYATVERVWVDSEALPLLDGMDLDGMDDAAPAEVVDLAAHRATRHAYRRYWVSAAAAAALVAAVILPQFAIMSPQQQGREPVDAAGETYRAGAGGTRTVTLADGSRLVLNRNTEVTVHLGRDARSAELVAGEAAFDVHHDAAHPFTVAAGGREVRVLGTEFDILNQAGAFGVTVRRGLVAVTDDGKKGAVTRLPAGTALMREAGAPSDTVSRVDADDAFAWTGGRLVYADHPIDAVARDLVRYGGGPVSVDRALRDMRVTGTIEIGDPAALDRQLEQLLPIRIEHGKDGRRIVPMH